MPINSKASRNLVVVPPKIQNDLGGRASSQITSDFLSITERERNTANQITISPVNDEQIGSVGNSNNRGVGTGNHRNPNSSISKKLPISHFDHRAANPVQTASGGKRVPLQIMDFPGEEFEIRVRDNDGSSGDLLSRN
jgi:hypothetical protein